jgi:hypothetical protein
MDRPMKRLGLLTAALAIVGAACGSATGDTPADDETTTATPPNVPATTAPATTGAPNDTVIDDGNPTATDLPSDLAIVVSPWPTNWSKRSIELDELLIGIGAVDPRDLIRPIDNPVYEDVISAGVWLEDPEQGILLEVAGEAIFYPIRILISHEIVNDQRGDVPFSLTYCPLCNTAAAFDRRVDGQVLRFGVSGLLRNSDLVMWDDATTSLWQQVNGEAIVGDFTGTQLEFLSTALIRWADFKENHPEGDVLSRESGPFEYGTNGYVGYTSRSAPFGSFFNSDKLDERFEALSRVVGVRVGEATKAYPFSTISPVGAVNDELNGTPLAVWWGAPDTADALDDRRVADGQAIGTGIAFVREVDGQILTFTANGDDKFTDAETGTTWNLLGRATDGPLAGTELEKALHQNEFWFAWSAFNVGAPVYGLE